MAIGRLQMPNRVVPIFIVCETRFAEILNPAVLGENVALQRSRGRLGKTDVNIEVVGVVHIKSGESARLEVIKRR